jgi:hypothetical protein
VFQDIEGRVFIINDEMLHQKEKVVVPGDNVLALVNADGDSGVPKRNLFLTSNIRILLTLLPRDRKDRKWLTQIIRDRAAAFVIELWSWEELVVVWFMHSV